MKVLKIIPVLLVAFCVGCSSGDDPGGPQVVGPTEVTDPTTPPTDNGSDNTDPFVYDATENLKDVVSFPMGKSSQRNNDWKQKDFTIGGY